MTQKRTTVSKSFDSESIKLIYNIATASYDTVIKRIDSLESKYQNVTTLGVTLFLAVPVLFKVTEKSITSPMFIVSMSLLLVSIVVSIISRFIGKVTVLQPDSFDEQWRSFNSDEFMLHLIDYAGEHYRQNSKLLHQKWWLNFFSFILLMISLFTTLVWALGNRS